MRIRLTRPARRELMRAAAWYDRERAELSDELLVEAGAAFKLLKDFPKASPPIWKEYRHRLLHVFPYDLVFRIEANEIIVVAVAHAKRRPGYWKKRLTTSEGRD